MLSPVADPPGRERPCAGGLIAIHCNGVDVDRRSQRRHGLELLPREYLEATGANQEEAAGGEGGGCVMLPCFRISKGVDVFQSSRLRLPHLLDIYTIQAPLIGCFLWFLCISKLVFKI